MTLELWIFCGVILGLILMSALFFRVRNGIDCGVAGTHASAGEPR